VKVFVDTNVLVSAVATRGLCADVLREVLVSHDLVLSQQVLDEVGQVLRSKLDASPDLAAEFVRLLEQDAVTARPARLPRVRLHDKDDIPILGAAIAARAQVLVTGDKELLELGVVVGVELLSPRQFWERLRSRRRQRPGRSGPVH
jgi:putative PIN family toxin of toxin-antitoxin system